MNTPDTFGGKAVLTMAHVIGMIDMVALPVWIGALMQHYRYSPPQAGITVTLFLLGVVLSSAFFAPRFNRTPGKAASASGFAIAGAAFFMASQQPVAATSFQVLAALHALAGLGVGCALTFTHGSIGRSANPHRLFAVANIVLGVFAVFFLGGMPQLIQHVGAGILFTVIAALMGLTAVVMALAFPAIPDTPALAGASTGQPIARPRIPGVSWFVIGVVICLTLNQSMVFAFLERIGAERGFGAERVNGVLIALGLVNLTPGVLAAVLQKKWSPVAVGLGGPVGQAVLAVVMTSAAVFLPYALAASLYVFMVIFTHNFLFGLLSRLDPSGRAAAATPAMMMVGPASASRWAGRLCRGWAACGVALVAVMAMLQVRRHLPAASAHAVDMQPLHA